MLLKPRYSAFSLFSLSETDLSQMFVTGKSAQEGGT